MNAGHEGMLGLFFAVAFVDFSFEYPATASSVENTVGSLKLSIQSSMLWKGYEPQILKAFKY